MKVLLGVTGSVAATLTRPIAEHIAEAGHEVQIVATKMSFNFWGKESCKATVYEDADEWHGAYQKGDEVLHIALRDWADLMLIAPLSANSLAKIANGMADNLLTSVARAWKLEDKPLIVAPAMNTHMWDHPVTKEHLDRLASWFKRFHVVPPIEKTLACGDVGIGALAGIDELVAAVKRYA